MIQKLEQHFASADRAGAMKLLQGTILPFLAGYTEKTHDMGLPRSLISLLALDISRYENGSEEGLLQAFRQLGAHGTLRTRLSGLISDEALLRYIQNTDFVRGPQENHFANQLMATAMRALSGEAGVEKQEAFRQILSAFLINESVYMPLNHTIIPMNWNGKLMFSELWVDPDAEGNLRKGGSEKDNTIRFLFKIDIQGLGFFDMVLGYRKDVVELLISCPEQVASHGTIVQRELVRILEENGLKSNGVQIQKMNRALTISAVFPKIFEGEKSINVKV
jgi:hypothetical protein